MFLVLDLFDSAPEVAAAPKPDAAPSIDLFGTGKANQPFSSTVCVDMSLVKSFIVAVIMHLLDV